MRLGPSLAATRFCNGARRLFHLILTTTKQGCHGIRQLFPMCRNRSTHSMDQSVSLTNDGDPNGTQQAGSRKRVFAGHALAMISVAMKVTTGRNEERKRDSPERRAFSLGSFLVSQNMKTVYRDHGVSIVEFTDGRSPKQVANISAATPQGLRKALARTLGELIQRDKQLVDLSSDANPHR